MLDRPAPRPTWHLRLALPALLAVTVLAAAPAAAQGPFRITFNVERAGSGVELSGTVVNEANADATDVRLRAEGLDGAGRVVTRAAAFVSPTVPARGSVFFSAQLPANPGVTGFRVTVTSYQFRSRSDPSRESP
ncbi:MAG: hypothetical protein HY727_08535 [Candidatus Rokubacteria bacterium]|nr:hypothetical protein [Candidatus Rokubacteria bacterium]